MAEIGKRYRGDNNKDEKHQKKRVVTSTNDLDVGGKYNSQDNGKQNNIGDGELVVYRILCPDGHLGSVIGKNGTVIKSLRHDTHSKIKIVEPHPDVKERIILLYCLVINKDDRDVNENDMRPLCAAQDALMRVHEIISNKVAAAENDKKCEAKARILVPNSQMGNIIGKSGKNIKNFKDRTNASFKITPKDNNNSTHFHAMSFDNFIEITGDTAAVRKALFLISSVMYKFSPKEEILPEDAEIDPAPSTVVPSDLSKYATGGFFPSADITIPSGFVPSAVATDLRGYHESGGMQPSHSPSVPILPGFHGASQLEELKIRVLCPSDKIGLVIGKGGSSIKSMRQESGAHIDIESLKDGCDECVVAITSKEFSDGVKSSAVEAVLLLQEKIIGNDHDDDVVRIRLLVPIKNIGCLIGKSGSIVKDLCRRTKAEVRIFKVEKPKCAQEDDALAVVIGKVPSIRDALVEIVLRLRDDSFKEQEKGNIATNHESLQLPSYSASIPIPPYELPSFCTPLGFDPNVEHNSGLGVLPSGSLYENRPLQAKENLYGSNPSYLSKPREGLSATLEIVIPANAVNKVMGKGGSNLENIRKLSGAMVEIVDSRASRLDRIALISGMPEQIKSAECLVQAFILAT